MRLYPAIDLIDGACVRLSQGSFDSKKIYATDPLEMVARFARAGAKAIHVVDLDGAKDPAKRQTRLLEKITRASALEIQAGGGVRSAADVESLLAAGVARVVVGTLAVEQPALVESLLQRFGGERLTLALDAFVDSQGQATVAARGWQERSRKSPQDLISAFLPAGLERVLCTDISKDGMLQGPNIALYRGLARAFPGIELQASGGVRSIEDLLALKAVPVQSVVVGKALYEGALDLAEAVRRC